MADQAAFSDLAMEYMPALYTAALRMTRNWPMPRTSSKRPT